MTDSSVQGVDVQRLDLTAEPASVGQARRFARQNLLAWELEELIDPVCLLTSELATNAVLHARTAYAVIMTRGEGVLRVDVLDDSPVTPERRRNSALAATGRGVALVETLATDWGATDEAGLAGFVKGVWFSLRLDSTDEAAWAGDWLDGL